MTIEHIPASEVPFDSLTEPKIRYAVGRVTGKWVELLASIRVGQAARITCENDFEVASIVQQFRKLQRRLQNPVKVLTHGNLIYAWRVSQPRLTEKAKREATRVIRTSVWAEMLGWVTNRNVLRIFCPNETRTKSVACSFMQARKALRYRSVKVTSDGTMVQIWKEAMQTELERIRFSKMTPEMKERTKRILAEEQAKDLADRKEIRVTL